MSAVVILIIPDTCIVFTSLGVIVLDIAKLVKLLKILCPVAAILIWAAVISAVRFSILTVA